MPSCAHIHDILVAGVPQENWAIAQPVFFGAALKDYVCLPDLPKASMEKYCHDLTIKEYDSDHWVQLSCHEVLNGDLESWINKTVVR
jgi:soluble epoxide hydrolase/lipid-phosphate phosphatase